MLDKPFSISQLNAFLLEIGVIADTVFLPCQDELITGFCLISETREGALAWGRLKELDLESVKARVVICEEGAEVPCHGSTLYIPTLNPLWVFAKIVGRFGAPERPRGISEKAVIGKDAKIGKDCYIGPYAVIGKGVQIDSGTIIHSGVHIYDRVRIGRNCMIHSGAVIGADGFGYARDENGAPLKIPQIGTVVIGDEVEIGANTCVDRGEIIDTVIGDHCKIDNLCHIAHSVRIGESTYVIAHAMVAGSVRIGSRTRIAPGAQISNGLSIGNNCFVGMGAIVARSVPDGNSVASVPARSITGLR